MQVILLERMRGLGNIGDVVVVKDGFARNYLFPRKKVLRATPKNKDFFEQQRAMLEQQDAELKAVAEAKAVSIGDGVVVNIYRQAGDDGKLYGSVTVKDIIEAIHSATAVELQSENVMLDAKIKQIGAFDIKVALHPDVILNLSLNVMRGEKA